MDSKHLALSSKDSSFFLPLVPTILGPLMCFHQILQLPQQIKMSEGGGEEER